MTLCDTIQDKILTFIITHEYKKGDLLPNENDLSLHLGVSRTALREALSRLKMMGLLESRAGKGIMLCEPTLLGGMRQVLDPRIMGESNLFDMLNFRIALEIGISSDLFYYMTPQDIKELEAIVQLGTMFANNEYAPNSEYAFHTKLYKITRNKTITEFQEIVHPVMKFVKDKFKDYLEPINLELKAKGSLVTHADLLELLKKGDEEGYKRAIEQHFEVYRIFSRKAMTSS